VANLYEYQEGVGGNKEARKFVDWKENIPQKEWDEVAKVLNERFC